LAALDSAEENPIEAAGKLTACRIHDRNGQRMKKVLPSSCGVAQSPQPSGRTPFNLLPACHLQEKSALFLRSGDLLTDAAIAIGMAEECEFSITGGQSSLQGRCP
jgi:hypothetical protein